jgi:Protein of unknown function (DUF642)
VRLKAIPTTLVVGFLACSCSPAPSPTIRPSPTPTAPACPGLQAGDPGFGIDSADNLIVNGSFGEPSINGHRTVMSLPGWTVSGKVELVAGSPCLPFPDNQYARLSFGGALAQTVPTTRGTTYNLLYSDARDGDCSTAGSELDVYWNGKNIGSDIAFAQGTTPTGGAVETPWGAYGSQTTEGLASGGTSEVRFIVTNAAVSCRFLLSNISLVVRPKATPAP